jgi:hypothetical protein
VITQTVTRSVASDTPYPRLLNTFALVVVLVAPGALVTAASRIVRRLRAHA